MVTERRCELPRCGGHAIGVDHDDEHHAESTDDLIDTCGGAFEVEVEGQQTGFGRDAGDNSAGDRGDATDVDQRYQEDRRGEFEDRPTDDGCPEGSEGSTD